MKPLVISIKEFLNIDKVSFISYLEKYISSYSLPLGQLQINVWERLLLFAAEPIK